MIERDRQNKSEEEAALAGFPVDGGAAASGLTTDGPATSGATPGFLRSVQMNLALNAKTRRN